MRNFGYLVTTSSSDVHNTIRKGIFQYKLQWVPGTMSESLLAAGSNELQRKNFLCFENHRPCRIRNSNLYQQ